MLVVPLYGQHVLIYSRESHAIHIRKDTGHGFSIVVVQKKAELHLDF